MPKKNKKERLPFWKSEKLPPEVRSLFAHIGKAADNMTHSQWSSLILYGALAGLSVTTFAKKERHATYRVSDAPISYGAAGYREILRLSNAQAQGYRDKGLSVEELNNPPESFDAIYDMSAFKNALIGPIALKVATAHNEVGGVAGTAILGTMGLLNVVPWGPAPKGTPLRAAEDWADWFVSQLGM